MPAPSVIHTSTGSEYGSRRITAPVTIISRLMCPYRCSERGGDGGWCVPDGLIEAACLLDVGPWHGWLPSLFLLHISHSRATPMVWCCRRAITREESRHVGTPTGDTPSAQHTPTRHHTHMLDIMRLPTLPPTQTNGEAVSCRLSVVLLYLGPCAVVLAPLLRSRPLSCHAILTALPPHHHHYNHRHTC